MSKYLKYFFIALLLFAIVRVVSKSLYKDDTSNSVEDYSSSLTMKWYMLAIYSDDVPSQLEFRSDLLFVSSDSLEEEVPEDNLSYITVIMLKTNNYDKYLKEIKELWEKRTKTDFRIEVFATDPDSMSTPIAAQFYLLENNSWDYRETIICYERNNIESEKEAKSLMREAFLKED